MVGIAPLDTGRPRSALIAQYFNQAAFALPAAGQYGNDGRTNMIAPGSFNTDLGLMKNFRMPREFGKLQFRAELFNLMNYVNLARP